MCTVDVQQFVQAHLFARAWYWQILIPLYMSEVIPKIPSKFVVLYITFCNMLVFYGKQLFVPITPLRCKIPFFFLFTVFAATHLVQRSATSLMMRDFIIFCWNCTVIL